MHPSTDNPLSRNILEGFLDLVFPPLCVLCRRRIPAAFASNCFGDKVLCPACRRTIILNRPPFCKKCSRPLKDPQASFCKSCERTPLVFDRAWGACLYNDTMRRLLHLFKYGGKTALRFPFWAIIRDFVATYDIPVGSFDLIVPVPLHSARYRERGFNQARILAQMLAVNYRILLEINNLRRVRPTSNQARLPQKDRWTNIQSAFKINQPSQYKDKNILIIDDLLTTGSTLSETARLLKSAGANEVSALTLAIAEYY